MKIFAVLFLLCTIYTVAFSAPAQNQQATVQDILAEIEDANMAARHEEKMVRIEQETFKALLKLALNNSGSLNKFLKPGTSAQYQTPYPYGLAEKAKIEQDTLKELLGSILNSANNFAQKKLGTPEMAKIEQETLKELLGSILNGANHYAQHKLSKPQEEETARIDETAVSQGMEEVDEQAFLAFLPLLTQLVPMFTSLLSSLFRSGQGDYYDFLTNQ